MSDLDPGAPVVSFVVLCYNLGRYVGECLSSILAQETDVPFEVIVIDDASTDDSADVIGRFADKRVRVIRHDKNRGHAYTVNEGLAAARGAFIARIDADDRIRPSFLSRTLPIFDRWPDVDLVYGDVAMIDGSGQVTAPACDTIHRGQSFRGSELIPLLENNFICSPSVIARREAWKRVPPVPEHLPFHDWYFTVSMARSGDFYYTNEVLAEYRVHSTNLHVQIAQDGREERGILWMLDHVYSMREANPLLDRAKRRARRRVYASHYIQAAEKYFGGGEWARARRAYGRAFLHKPTVVLRSSRLRHWLTTILFSKASYVSLKRSLQRTGSP